MTVDTVRLSRPSVFDAAHQSWRSSESVPSDRRPELVKNLDWLDTPPTDTGIHFAPDNPAADWSFVPYSELAQGALRVVGLLEGRGVRLHIRALRFAAGGSEALVGGSPKDPPVDDPRRNRLSDPDRGRDEPAMSAHRLNIEHTVKSGAQSTHQ